MDPNTLLSVPENRSIARSIIQEVLGDLEPDELGVTERYIDPLMEMSASDTTATATGAKIEGGLGPTDLMVTLVVPITVGVLANLLEKFGEHLLVKLRQAIRNLTMDERKALVAQVVAQEVKTVITRTRSRRGKNRSEAIEQVVTTTVTKALMIDD